MKMRNVVIMLLTIFMSISLLKPPIVKADAADTIIGIAELLGKLIPGDPLKNGLEDFKISKEIDEQHAFGENIVFVHEATNKKGEHGHIFIAYNKEKKKIMNWLFCSDEKDTYPKFQKMNLLGKKVFLLENFRQYANVDLGPVYPQLGATYEQTVVAIGAPDDRIPLYYEEGIAISEMLIYHISDKKFLAVDIARGKVARTQELEIKEGQGLKDTLAAAGIIPTAMKPDNQE